MPSKSPENIEKSYRMRKPLLGIAGFLILAFGGLWLMHMLFKPKGQLLQDAIAREFNGIAGSVIPNIPPRNARYPGAVLAVSPHGQELLVRPMERPKTHLPPIVGDLDSVQLDGSSAAWELTARRFGSRVTGSGDAVVQLNLKNVRIFEEPANKLAAELRSDPRVRKARSCGEPLVVVTTAYEAIPTIIVRQSADAKSGDWVKLKSDLLQANGSLTNDDSVVFKSDTPQIVAFVTRSVKFVSHDFGPGNLSLSVSKTPQPAWRGRPMPKPTDFNGTKLGESVAFAVIASPKYSSPDLGDLPAATSSASLVAALFEATGSKRIDTGLSVNNRLTEKQFKLALQKLVKAVKIQKPRAVVLYYVGHSISGMSGASYLVMGDYHGNLTNDLEQSSPFIPDRSPTDPLAGDNEIDDIAKVVAAAGQQFATFRPGFISLTSVYNELAETGVPFAIIVDGCYPAKAMTDLKNHLSGMFWWDTQDFGETAGYLRDQEYSRALRTYGEAPYLRSENPVIFAAKPGTFSPVVQNPLYSGDLVPGVGWLAAKMTRTYLNALLNQQDLSLGDWLSSIVDFDSSGDRDYKGSISWSNFDKLDQVPMVSFTGEN